MKKIFLIICLCMLPLFANAKFVYNDIYTAQKHAQKEAKLMLFFVVAESCKYCHQLLDDVFNNKEFLAFLNKKFIVAISDLDNKGVIPKDLIFNGVTPTTYILTPTGKVIGMPIEGAVDSNTLFGLLKGLEEYKRGQLGF